MDRPPLTGYAVVDLRTVVAGASQTDEIVRLDHVGLIGAEPRRGIKLW